jgi:hypothetical protein
MMGTILEEEKKKKNETKKKYDVKHHASLDKVSQF